MRKTAFIVAAVLGIAPLLAAETPVKVNEFAAGSVSQEEGLEIWGRIYQVLSHPRCSNCHVGADNIPMWSGPSYGGARPHGMHVNGGESRIGAEYVPCGTCHGKSNSPEAHGAPGVENWRLAPVEAEWFGKSSAYICNQVQDPERNGDRTIRDVAEHLDHDLILHWAWAPGGEREAAPYSLQQTMDFIMQWGAAGTPCPSE
jgi:hypothetical protein